MIGSMQDKREKTRRELTRAIRAAAPGKPPLACLLVDVSESGARLGFANPAAMPDEFALALADDMARWCRVMWRNDRQVGVKFVPKPADASADSPTVTARPAPKAK
jgi:hypothetical protein